MNFSKEMPLEQQNIEAVKTSREEEFANEIKNHLFNEFEIEAINSFLHHLNNSVKKELNQRIELLEAETSKIKLVLENL
jgi:hypothetical protein